MMKQFTTELIFGRDFALKSLKEPCAIITDDQVVKLLPSLPHPIFSFPAGEQSKTREVKQAIEDQLFQAHFGRDSLFVGVGGGVVCDLVGFLASTFCRGVRLIFIPTTLLAMVDAAIGGKNGVNTPLGKNLVGTIYPPEKILIDEVFIDTLPERERKSGWVEMLKAALIDSAPLFEKMKTEPMQIKLCIEIKQKIVAEDPLEKLGPRRKINLGHTFGHAIETLENFQMTHGEAVAIGLLASGFISNKMGLLSQEELQEIWDALKNYGVPLRLPHPIQPAEIRKCFAADKKAQNGIPRFVLLEKIGSVAPFGGEYCTKIEEKLLDDTIQWVNQNFGGASC